LNQLAERYGFSFNRVFIRRQRTRWGSCSAANNISLNIKLTLLPDELRDFIIVHELVHTKVKNHGQKFWNRLEKIFPRARSLDRQLKSYSGLLFLS
jgi:predicted metal-dependent hydrolase